jgi:hypothetical protein
MKAVATPHSPFFVYTWKNFVGGTFLRSENEVRKKLEMLKQNMMTGLPYSELKTIAWHGTKQALEWVLEESDKCLSY